ncbi:beta-1,4-galactosyltransferase 6 [Phyllostomus discolor]|uniref:Beta-1,4-galactosyltransferase 6 n=1 Tax=Phyllostomus discolor TaxID=89673 RepID=A0A833Z9F4_9CHIR|nr:beta-1,4-galactosyltransferase 6 [Phyllostomus discolor]
MACGTASSSTMWTTYPKMTGTIMGVEKCHVTLQQSWINTCIFFRIKSFLVV